MLHLFRSKRPVRHPAAALLPAALLLAALLPAACGSGDADYESEGTRSGPEDLGTAPVSHDGETGPDGSYYLVSVPDQNDNVSVTVSDLEEDVDLFVYRTNFSSSSIDCASTNSGTSNESCTSNQKIGDVYIHIKLVSEDQNGTEFDLSVNIINN